MNNSSGPRGEQYAADYLEQHGWHIVARNYSSRFGEIDLIAQNDRFLIFTEVKTREEGSLENPFEAVTAAKQRRIARTAELFLLEHPTELQPRFDVAAVTTRQGRPAGIRYLENAFSNPSSY